MAAEVGDFRYSSEPQPHPARTKAILRDHPEVRKLFGPNPWSLAVIVATVGLQMSLAYLLRDQSWWLIAAVAWFVGAFANHAMYVMIHEAAHGAIMRRRGANELAGILADTVNVIPAAMSFRSYHLKHHSFQGVYHLDADLPSRWEAWLIGSGVVGKLFWFMLFPIFEISRPLRLQGIRFVTLWTCFNWAVVLGVDAAILWLWGPKALTYLVCSFFFSIGPHPLGARWIQEHYLLNDEQETYSYYGPLNLLALNVGYHQEHHDFPAVAWNRLPEVKRLAPEYYESLDCYRSWTKLFFRFLFDPKLSHYSRVVRSIDA
jgi:sphingolipid delta-4 desaturase